MRFTHADRRRIKANVELTPLIDVVFQLLIFFMLSSTFVVQTSIPVEIPKAQGAENLEQKDFSITLLPGEGGPDNAGKIYFKGVEEVEITSWRELANALREAHHQQPEALVLIRADENIRHGRLVRVLGTANRVGIRHYGIAAQPPQEEE